MRDPEMYNHVRQVLESMRDHGIGLRHALGMHGHNMTDHEVRQVIAERRDLQRLSEQVLGPGDDFPWDRRDP